MSNETRKLPTRPGWWWGIPKTWNEDRETQAIRVAQSPYSNDLLASGLASVGVWLEDVDWLAPIPGPDVCAALAEYGEAYSLMILDARRGGSYANGEARRVRLAEDALDDAIRAERDGAA